MIINTEFNTEDCCDEEYGPTTYPYYANMFDGEEDTNDYTIKDFLLKSSNRKSHNLNFFKDINQRKVNTKYNKNLKQRFTHTNRKIFK